MRKLSCPKPSTNLPRSSRTVVWSTTKLTCSLMWLPVWDSSGGGGGGGVSTGIWASKGPAKKSRVKERARKARNEKPECWRSSVRRGVVAGLGVDRERREAFWRAQFDLDFAPARIVNAVAWSVSQNILISQLHADLGRNVRQII